MPNIRNMIFALLGATFLFWLVETSMTSNAEKQATPYSQFIVEARDGKIKHAVVSGKAINYERSDSSRGFTYNPGDSYLVSDMLKYGVTIESRPEEKPSLIGSIFMSWFPMLLLIGVMLYMSKGAMGGGKGNPFNFGKNKARMLEPGQNQITFADVAGCDEAKADVAEIVDFLKEPDKYHSLGGRIPKGILLAGHPGTGKTLLAKAIAGEANVPFFTISGSDFVEMFVGVGASRVRELFGDAKKQAPCIIFIDEIDAVGRSRGAGHGGGNDEREQTLNQLLVEMDGFEGTSGIIVIAATNRPDVLDKALLRPGRFDRQVMVGLPDIKGRKQILNVHARKAPIGKDVDIEAIAKGCPGFSGAELANLVNEAALCAARGKKKFIEMIDFEKAKDKIIMGAERNVVMPEEERRNTAYHEAGHALVAHLLPKTDPVHKISIIPRGRALGVTVQLPTEDKYSKDKENLLSTLAVLFGGRIAEEIFMNQMTTGASNDFERASAIARKMVTQWGMSSIGIQVFGATNESFLGSESEAYAHVSETTKREIDMEINKLLNQQYKVAFDLIEANKDKMHDLAKYLLEWETLDGNQFKAIMNGATPAAPSDYEAPANKAQPQDLGQGGSAVPV